jgi:histidinol-phosphate aminotransferase
MSETFDIENIVSETTARIKRTENVLDRSKFLRLDKNENLLEYNFAQIQGLRELIESNILASYCDLNSSYDFLADRFECKSKNILLTSGADLAIKSIYETFVNHRTLLILPELAYGMHEVYLKQFGSDVLKLTFNSDLTLNLYDSFDRGDSPKIVFIESPSGVTGKSIADEEIEKFALKYARENTVLVVDETYAGITKQYIPTSIVLGNQNLISIRSFSKGFGLAGMRGGMILANTRIVNAIAKVKPMHEISSLTAKAIEFLASDNTRTSAYTEFVRLGHSQIRDSIDPQRYALVIGDGNFYLIKPNYSKNIELDAFARDHGILIRSMFLNGSLKGFYRVTIGSFSQNEMFLRVLGLFERL